ncbi:hypothetical protein EZV62_006193 [Acer yangbiense]|uniref:DYW domain-containing protein n=1 Tax=Acer yangbiense TaxID=1000413 RepID=A0A5C7IQ89_9ROSI|nr:hypothetical protein EZV62_006193 [Acer yangbiense]
MYSTYNGTLKTHLTEIISTNVGITKHSKKGQLDIARYVFDQMPKRSVNSWNTMISRYSKWGKFNESLSLVSIMHGSYVKLNETTFSTVLSVCAQLKCLINGKQIHDLVLKSGYESFEFVGSSLLYFYRNCFEIEEAKRVFEELREENGLLWSAMLVGYVQCNMMSDAFDLFMRMPRRDVVMWTKLISGYVTSEDVDGCEKALELFRWMIQSGEVMNDEFTFDAVVRGCDRLGVLHEGRAVHGMLIKCGYEFDHLIRGALIEFYCSCEHINEAKRVYDRVANPGLDASSSIISGLILKKHPSLTCTPNVETLLKRKHHLTASLHPMWRHGQLLLMDMRVILFERALLGACWFWMNMEEGKKVAKKIFGFDPKPVSAYVTLIEHIRNIEEDTHEEEIFVFEQNSCLVLCHASTSTRYHSTAPSLTRHRSWDSQDVPFFRRLALNYCFGQ